jgi:tryptophan-rich sensory protein
VQLVLNMLWSPLFFGAGLLGLAFADILLLAASVVATIVLFAREAASPRCCSCRTSRGSASRPP